MNLLAEIVKEIRAAGEMAISTVVVIVGSRKYVCARMVYLANDQMKGSALQKKSSVGFVMAIFLAAKYNGGD